jgi:16S rRNA (guanine527-N7)-methyltransferase
MSRAISRLGVEVPTEAPSRLEAFEVLLRERAAPLGIVSASDVPRLRERHVLDCLRAAVAVRESDVGAYDIGSGAGLPGIVVAVARPALVVRLVEPRRSRAAFLELAVERLELANAIVLQARIEELAEPVDLCFARAFAPLQAAWSAALPRLRPGGRLVYFSGRSLEPLVLLGGASAIDRLDAPLLESSGPLTIMTR